MSALPQVLQSGERRKGGKELVEEEKRLKEGSKGRIQRRGRIRKGGAREEEREK